MSADNGGVSGPPDSEQSTQLSEPIDEAYKVEQSLVLLKEKEEKKEQVEDKRKVEEEKEDWSEGGGRDCVVCQNAAVTRVLLPCRHTCVCDSCVSHFQHCPICRAFILESFTLALGPAE